MSEMGMRLLYKMMNVRMSSMNCFARPEREEVSKRYHWELEKNHDLMLLPTVDPRDNARSRTKRKTIWTLTCLSTAVRLIGAALDAKRSVGHLVGLDNLTLHFASILFHAQ